MFLKYLIRWIKRVLLGMAHRDLQIEIEEDDDN
jgi:hypothetical protein